MLLIRGSSETHNTMHDIAITLGCTQTRNGSILLLKTALPLVKGHEDICQCWSGSLPPCWLAFTVLHDMQAAGRKVIYCLTQLWTLYWKKNGKKRKKYDYSDQVGTWVESWYECHGANKWFLIEGNTCLVLKIWARTQGWEGLWLQVLVYCSTCVERTWYQAAL